MFPLTDDMRPKRFPIVNTAIIAACFAVWIFYELPHLRHRWFTPAVPDAARRLTVTTLVGDVTFDL